jgi:glutamate-1-semialdehyde 2,1-aminomutase
MKIVAIVQARMGSSRFPGKVLKKVNGKSIVSLVYERLLKSKKIDEIVVSTSVNKKDNILANHLKKNKIKTFRGSEANVLDRFYKTAKKYKADWIVRITADCPLVDYKIVDIIISKAISKKIDYVTTPLTYPDGFDVECFSFNSLFISWKNSKMKYEIEHVTPYMRFSKKINKLTINNKENYSKLKLSVNEPGDLGLIKKIYNYFYPNILFGFKEIIKLYKIEPSIFKKDLNKKKFAFNSGQKLWIKAKKIIPSGNMLLSKRPEMHLPNFWPTYFSKTKGCEIWDLDNKKYFDLSFMGVGTNVLGYSNQKVDMAVNKSIIKGNMSSLNCPEEVELAEKLIEMHPWFKMVKFARSGGEANSIAIRIARAASGKDKVAVCGYHGWHDWYLAANLSNKNNLNAHLLKNLNIKGVPKFLKNTIFTFEYNNFNQINDLIKKNPQIGVIKMEVSRNSEPKNNFLKKVRNLAYKNNIVLIFDECTSGFRETYGGLHKKYGVKPDIAIFGKALGNGYAITAIIGKKEIMEVAQETFISSTFWTERVGPTAALATLNMMEKYQTWKQISVIGKKIKENWIKLANKFNLKIQVYGISSIPTFDFVSKNKKAYKTYLTQEMLKKGFLAGTSIYVCTEHKKNIINKYFDFLEEIFFEINQFDKGDKENILNHINGPLCHDSFERLN